jgi:hypothetical protein
MIQQELFLLEQRSTTAPNKKNTTYNPNPKCGCGGAGLILKKCRAT